MERQQRTRLVTILVLSLVFGTGFVVGMAVDRTATATPAEDTGMAEAPERDDPAEERGGEGDEGERGGSVAFQVDGLTEEQKVRIDSIVDDFRAAGREVREERDAMYQERYEARFDSLRAEWRAEYGERFQPRLDSLVLHTRDAIKGVMTAEQAQRYDSLLAEYTKRREERRNEHDSGDARRN